MTKIIQERMTAQIDGDFVVFLIGMRINSWWKVHKWLPLVKAMPNMIKELESLPPQEIGFLGHNGQTTGSMVQYWRSFDHLEAYARSNQHSHFPVWADFNRRMKNNRSDVGIWHETYLVKDGEYETLYSGMPPHGLGKFSKLIPATGNRSKAKGRLTS